MEKRVIALVIAVLIIASTFVACAKRSKYGKIYVDYDGVTHVLATDENGETVRGEDGNLYEVQFQYEDATDTEGTVLLDEGGEWLTTEYEFPKYIVVKEAKFKYFPILFHNKYVQNSVLKLPLPDGFEQISKRAFHIENEESGCWLECSADDYKSLDEAYLKAKEVLPVYVEAGSQIEDGYVTICGEKAYRCIITNDEDNIILTTYYFEKNDHLIRFQTLLKTDYADEIDFEAIINTAIF